MRWPRLTQPRSTRARSSRSASISASSPLPSARRSRACVPPSARARRQGLRRRRRPIATARARARSTRSSLPSPRRSSSSARAASRSCSSRTCRRPRRAARCECAARFRGLARRALCLGARSRAPDARRQAAKPSTSCSRPCATGLSRSTAASPGAPSCSRCATCSGGGSSLPSLPPSIGSSRTRSPRCVRCSIRRRVMRERAQPEPLPSVEARFRSFDRLATAFAVFDQRPEAHPFQPGLCRALAARRRMARNASARRRDPRPPAPGSAPAREGRLP